MPTQVSFSSYHKDNAFYGGTDDKADRGVDIVCFSLARYDAPISSPGVALAKEFSKKHRVFFIEHPYSYKDRLQRLVHNFATRRRVSLPAGDLLHPSGGNVTVVTPPLTYPINFLPEGKLYDYASRINNNILLNTLRQVIKQNNITRYIFINCFDPFFLNKIPADIQPHKYVYHCMDDISQVAYTSRHGLRLEAEIIAHADCTLCTSHELRRLRSHLSNNVYFLPNAADTALFNKAFQQSYNRPADMHFPGKKIIGFTGSIEYRTDFDLLKSVAKHHPDKIIYLIGPVYGAEHLGIKNISNIVFAGAKPIDELPAYVQYFDCAIIPYKKNTLTRSIYPLKINEYLAAGLPVVATNFSENIYSFCHSAYVVNSDEEFISAIDTAISENSVQKQQQRVEVAASNSWTKRVHQFWDILSG